MTITLHPPAGPWTIDDIQDIQTGGFRLELHEGNLCLLTASTVWQSGMRLRIANALNDAGRPAEIGLAVLRSSTSMRIADVLAFGREPHRSEQVYWTPTEVALVVITSSEAEDRLARRHWFAAARVPEYWQIAPMDDPSDAVIFQFGLATTAGGTSAYVQTAVTTLTALEAKAQGSNL